MTDPTADGLSEVDALVAEIADEFRARRDRGEDPDPEEYAARHPAEAAVVRRVLAALSLVPPARPSPPPAGAEVGWGRLGDFRILREVGRGGMGVVYEAEQESLGRRVALKVVPFAATADPRHLDRFRHEARAAALLHHPHIVPVYAVGADRGVHYYAMQFVDGRTAADLITDTYRPAAPAARTTAAAAASTAPNSRPRDFFRTAARVCAEAAEALEHAHAAGVVHRDVKPGNLLVDAGGHTWVADFGLAKLGAGAGVTGTGDVLGTLRYMAPEQAEARHNLVDHRADVYSLGATLYELLTGRPAVPGEDRRAVLRRVLEADPVPPRRVDRRVPADLETVCLKCLEKDPAERYQTAGEAAADLRRHLLDKPIQARRASVVQRARRTTRRHADVIVTVAVAVVTVSLLGLVGLAVSNQRVRQEQLRTQIALTRAEREKAVAQAVRDFLRNALLSQANPRAQADALRRGGGEATAVKPDPTVRELLDRAAVELIPDRIDGPFPGQPLVQAEILRTVGEAYAAIGEYGPAVAHLDRARELQARELGPEHPDTLATVVSLARAHLSGGKPETAAAMLQTVCDLRREVLGPGDPDTLASLNDLARCHFRLRQHAKALAIREEIVHLRRAGLDPDHRDTLESANNLANSYAAVGRIADALTLHQDTRARRARTLGADDPDTLQSLNNVANCHAALGQMAVALRLHQEALDRRRARLGPDHPDALQSQNNVAVACSALGRYAEARRLYEETLARRVEKLGPDHPDTIQSTNALAWLLANCPDRTLRDPDKALELAKQAVALAPAKGDYQNTLGTAYYRVGDWKNAVGALTKSAQLRKGGDGSDWFVLAMAHWHLGDKDQGRASYDRAVQWVEKNKRQGDEELRQFRAEAAELLGAGRP